MIRRKMSDRLKAQHSAKMKALWADPEYRAKTVKGMNAVDKTASNEARKEKISAGMKARWAQEGAKEQISANQSAGQINAWADPEKRALRIAKRNATLAKKKEQKNG